MASSIRSASDGGQDQRPLAEALKATTRPIHKKLNRLIMCRMPLALPPRANDPPVYATGLLHIAPIYMAFEALWEDILTPPGDELDSSRASGEDKTAGPIPLEDFKKPAIPLKLGLILSKLFLPGLRRTGPLRRDLESLTGWSSAELNAEIRRLVTSGGSLSEFTRRIRESVEERPHVLISYGYILYMALFAGGRFIRSSLESQGASFWDKAPASLAQPGMATGGDELADGDINQDSKPVKKSNETGSVHSHASSSGPHSPPPVSFLRFETPSDGEELKNEFKGRLLDAECLLSENEKEEIIQEAAVIFEEMLSVVQQLDEHFNHEKPSDALSVASGLFGSAQEAKLTDRLRDSVMVTRERKVRQDAHEDGDAFPGSLPVLGEERVSQDSEVLPRAIPFSNDLEHVPVVAGNSEKIDSVPVTSALDRADDEVDGDVEKQSLAQVTENQPLLQGTERHGAGETRDEEEVAEQWNQRRVLLPFLAKLTVVASFTWLVMCITAMLLGRSEPFRRGCPNYNPYDS